MTPRLRARISESSVNWRSSTAWQSSRWECPTTWRPRSRRARPAFASALPCSANGRRRERALTVGFYSPMPPARTGVADYAASLLEALREHGPVELAPQKCDAPLYHIGNNALHAG